CFLGFFTELFNRAHTAMNWQTIEARKGHLEQYSLSKQQFSNLHAWVLSLPQSADRRASISKQLQRAGVAYEIIDAVDGQDDLPAEEVAFMESRDRLTAFQAGNKYMRAKVGGDLSHAQVLQRMLGEHLPIGLVMEDDAKIPPDFLEQLYNAINALPNDWDVLHLNGCNVKASKLAVRKNIHVNHQSSCYLAYAFRRRYALQVLQMIFKWRLHKDIDDYMGSLTSSGIIQSYITMPFIVDYSGLAANSTIEVWRQNPNP
ncbi:hypothetical protein WJX84_005038, partial [Apatococcus fuscideae]